MEKKLTNTYAGLNKSVLERLNRNFQAEPIKDLNRISEIMSIFIEGDLKSIDSVLSSSEILNFKTRPELALRTIKTAFNVLRLKRVTFNK